MLLLSFIIPTSLFSQSYEYNQLLLEISRPQLSDSLKARLIFDWITQHISYDREAMQALYSESVGSEAQKPEVVLSTRKALCGGYSNLFAHLSKKAGLKAEVIVGYSKEGGKVTALNDEIYHAWNAVKIDDDWKLVDVTWGAGYGSDTGFVAIQNWDYFFANPPKFVQSHLPFDPVWQLLTKPISLQDFLDYDRIPIEPGDYQFQQILASVEQLDSLDRDLLAMQRILDFDPSRVRYHYGIAGIYCKKGATYLAKSEALFNEDADDGMLQQRKEILYLLAQAKGNFQNALSHLSSFEEAKENFHAEEERVFTASEIQRMLQSIQMLENILQQ